MISAASSAHGPEPRSREDQRPASEPPHRGFAEIVADRVERNDDRPFANGTMAASVEAFGAHGLLGQGSVISADVDVTSTQAAANAKVAVATATLGEEVASLRADRLSPTTSVATVKSPTIGHSAPGPRVSATVTRAGRPTAAFSATFAQAGLRPAPPEIASPKPTRAPVTRASVTDASKLKVLLHTGEGGALVSIAGEPAALGDGHELQDAVERLLARHGLTLDALRIMRRQSNSGER